VLDFWATWCGPCVASIPHMSSIARRWADKNVHVIGTAIWPRKGMTPTREFVADYDEVMEYTVAVDVGRRTARDFMEAAGQNGIPLVMVVNGQGNIAWMGHPMDGLTDVLKGVVAGDFDLAEHESRMKQRTERGDELYKQFQTAAKAEDWEAVAELSDQMVTLDPTMFAQFAVYHYATLVRLDQDELAAEYGRNAVETTLHGSASELGRIAWLIVDPSNETEVADLDLELAMAAAQRANVLTRHKTPSLLDTLARVQFLRGHLNEAIDLQKRAVVSVDDGPLRVQLQDRMDEYLRARDAADS